jgi:hypothetical protein
LRKIQNGTQRNCIVHTVFYEIATFTKWYSVVVTQFPEEEKKLCSAYLLQKNFLFLYDLNCCKYLWKMEQNVPICGTFVINLSRFHIRIGAGTIGADLHYGPTSTEMGLLRVGVRLRKTVQNTIKIYLLYYRTVRFEIVTVNFYFVSSNVRRTQ